MVSIHGVHNPGPVIVAMITLGVGYIACAVLIIANHQKVNRDELAAIRADRDTAKRGIVHIGR